MNTNNKATNAQMSALNHNITLAHAEISMANRLIELARRAQKTGREHIFLKVFDDNFGPEYDEFTIEALIDTYTALIIDRETDILFPSEQDRHATAQTKYPTDDHARYWINQEFTTYFEKTTFMNNLLNKIDEAWDDINA